METITNQKDIKQIKSDNFEIQKAIKFLSDLILDDNGNQKKLGTTKPLLVHSLRVGLTLYNYGYDKELSIAGILHDTNEDAGVSFSEIKKRFGDRVANLVHAVSYDRTIPEGEERIRDAHNRKKAAGKDAIILSIADHLENLPYIKYAETKEVHDRVLKSHQRFAEEIAVLVSDELIYKNYIHELKFVK